MATHAERKRYRRYYKIARRRQEHVLSLDEWRERHTKAPENKQVCAPPAYEGEKESLNDDMESSKPTGKNGKNSRSSTKRSRYGRVK